MSNKKLKINKEVQLSSSVAYINNLFNELRERKIKLAKLVTPHVTEEFDLLFYVDKDADELEVDKYEKFVWEEYSRLKKELKEIEGEENE